MAGEGPQTDCLNQMSQLSAFVFRFGHLPKYVWANL
jgi:hypothetical protein